MGFATALAAVGTVAQVGGNIKTQRAQRRSAAAQRRLQTLERNKQRRQAFREAQLARSRATVQAAGMGALGSSGFQGGVGSLSSQLGANLGFSSQAQGISNQISQFGVQASQGQLLSGLGGQVAQFGFNQGAFQPQTTAPAMGQPPAIN
jgi:hypothetical protein